MKKLFYILAAVVLLAAAFLAYEGFFTPAKVEVTTEGPYLLMGLDHKGAYHDIGPVFHKLEELAKEKQIADPRFAGVYFDDPKTVAESELRSIATVVVTNVEDSLKLAGIEGIRAYPVGTGKALVCERNTGDMVSMIISVMKAYPALGAYIEAHPEYHEGIKHVYELYIGNKTRFVFQY